MPQLNLLSLIALAAASVTMSAEAATFTKIADTSVVSSDGTTFFTFGTPQLSGGTVVFVGRSLNGLTVLLAAPAGGGPLVALADTNTKVPHGSGDFSTGRDYLTAFGPDNCSPPVIGSKSAVFVGRDAAGNEGLYSVPLVGGRVVRLADYSTPVPGGYQPDGHSTFYSDYSFCHIAVSGTTVVFDAGANSGVYTVKTNGTGLARIADYDTPSAAPNPFPTVKGYGLPSILGKTAAYIGSTTGGPFGIYVGGTTGVGTAVISSASSEASDFDQFAYPVLGGKTVLFSALKNGDDSILSLIGTNGSGFKTIFDTATTKVPAGSLGDSFSQLGTQAENFSGNDGTRQIFTAISTDASPKPYAAYDGVFSRCKSKLSKVLQTGDDVGSLQVNAVYGISQLQRVSAGGAPVDQFAAELTASTPSTPSVYGGSLSIYVVGVPGC